MLLGILLIVIAGIIYYSTHKIPPEPIFKKEMYVEEEDFWDDLEESDFEEHKAIVVQDAPASKPNRQKERYQEKKVHRRRKRRRIAKNSRQKNRS
jgi:hypothetical protein